MIANSSSRNIVDNGWHAHHIDTFPQLDDIIPLPLTNTAPLPSIVPTHDTGHFLGFKWLRLIIAGLLGRFFLPLHVSPLPHNVTFLLLLSSCLGCPLVHKFSSFALAQYENVRVRRTSFRMSTCPLSR